MAGERVVEERTRAAVVAEPVVADRRQRLQRAAVAHVVVLDVNSDQRGAGA